MKRRIITLFFSLLFLTVNAQNVTITGRSNKTNTLMRLFSYEDLVNETGFLLDQSQTDAQGNFILEGNVKQILPARIYVGLEYVDIILTPNASYDIEIIVPEKNDNVSYFEKELPTILVKRATDKGIYRQIIYSEEIINGYMIDHFNQIYRGRQVRYIDSIQNAISKNESLQSAGCTQASVLTGWLLGDPLDAASAPASHPLLGPLGLPCRISCREPVLHFQGDRACPSCAV